MNLLLNEFSKENNAISIVNQLLIISSIIGTTGFIDDLNEINMKLKFGIQALVSILIIYYSNFYSLEGYQAIYYICSYLALIILISGIINLINFMDGIDGLAITEAIKVILLVEFFSTHTTPLFSLGIITVLGLLPLYYFNFKKDHKVFLGDAGSLFLGTLIAIYLFYVLGSEYNLKTSFSTNKPFLAMSLIVYPLVDLLRVFIIRIRNKKSPFSPDQNHLHHLLVKKNVPHFMIVLILLSLSLVFLLVPFGV